MHELAGCPEPTPDRAAVFEMDELDGVAREHRRIEVDLRHCELGAEPHVRAIGGTAHDGAYADRPSGTGAAKSTDREQSREERCAKVSVPHAVTPARLERGVTDTSVLGQYSNQTAVVRRYTDTRAAAAGCVCACICRP